MAQSAAVHLQETPHTLDWNRAYTASESSVLINLMEGLTQIGEQGQILPALATRWTLSRDKMTYTFYLRKDVRWSDGEPLSAEQFLHSWERLRSPKTGARYHALLEVIDFEHSAARALSPSVLEIRLKHPTPSLPALFSLFPTFPIRKELIEKWGDQHWTDPDKLVTLGAFRLESTSPKGTIRLRRNPLYTLPHGTLEQVSFVNSSSPEPNSIDLTQSTTPKDASTVSRPTLEVLYLGFNPKHPLTRAEPLREAISRALDLSKLEQPNPSFVPAWLWPQGHPPKQLHSRLDLKQARTLIKSIPKTQLKITLPLLCLNQEEPLKIARWIKEELRTKLGLSLSIQPLENAQYYKRRNMQQDPLFLGSWAGDTPDPETFVRLFHSENLHNPMHWSDPLYDHYADQSARESRKYRRQCALYSALDRLIEMQSLILPLTSVQNHILASSRVKNWSVNPRREWNLKNAD